MGSFKAQAKPGRWEWDLWGSQLITVAIAVSPSGCQHQSYLKICRTVKASHECLWLLLFHLLQPGTSSLTRLYGEFTKESMWSPADLKEVTPTNVKYSGCVLHIWRSLIFLAAFEEPLEHKALAVCWWCTQYWVNRTQQMKQYFKATLKPRCEVFIGIHQQVIS